MGQSTDAILVYGYDLGDEASEDGFEKLIPQRVKDEIAQLPGYYDLEESIPRFLAQHGVHGVEIVHHCRCGDYTMRLLVFEVARAWRGDVKRLDLTQLENDRIVRGWHIQVSKAAYVLGIKIGDQPPGWMIVSMWC